MFGAIKEMDLIYYAVCCCPCCLQELGVWGKGLCLWRVSRRHRRAGALVARQSQCRYNTISRPSPDHADQT